MHKGTISHRRRLFGVIAAASLILVACGSDDDSSSSDTTAGSAAATAPTDTDAAAPTGTEAPSTDAPSTDAPTSEAPTTEQAADEPTGEPVLVAALADATSATASAQQFAGEILDAWAAKVNANGGVNGHPVEIELRDSAGDPATAQAALDELVALDPALIYIADAAVEASLAESLTATGVPIVGVGYNPAVWGGSIAAFGLECSTDEGAAVPCALPNAFPITTTFGAVIDEQVIAAQQVGATKLATAACAEVDSCSAAGPVFDATAEALGIENIGITKVSSSAADYSAECIQFIQQGVDYIQLSGPPDMATRLISDCTDQGYEGVFGASAGSVGGALLDVQGATIAGGLNAAPWWVDDQPIADYRDALEAAGVAEEAWSNPNGTGTWSVMELWKKALSNTDLTADDPITAEASLAAMYTLKDETLGGLISPVTFTEGELAANRPCFWPFTLRDGTFEALNGGLAYTCNPPES